MNIKRTVLASFIASSLLLSGCELNLEPRLEQTTTEYTGVTVIGIQNNRPVITEETEETTETIVPETTLEPIVDVWVYNNFDGVDIEGEDYPFSKRITAFSSEEADTFINEFLSTYNGRDPYLLVSAGEYSVFEYIADNGTVIVYIDDYYYEETLTQLDEEPATTEVETDEEGNPIEHFKKVIECYYIDMSAFNSLGNVPSTIQNKTWDRLNLVSSVVDVVDAWNNYKPDDFEPIDTGDYKQIDYLMTGEGVTVDNNEGRIFIDDYGRPVFARYYKNTGNISEIFIYNNATSELYMRMSFSGTAFAPKEDHDEGLILAVYYFDDECPNPYSIRDYVN